MSNSKFDPVSFSAGLIGGAFGTSIAHPFDTIKTVFQSDINGNHKNILDCSKYIYKTNGIKGFYRGVLPPVIGIGIEKCIVFGTYSNVKNMNMFQNYYSNVFFGGVVSGICCTSIVTPVEKIKIVMQNAKSNENISVSNMIKKEGIQSLYKGWSATLFREVPGYGIYFATYEYCKAFLLNKNKTEMKPYHTMLFGALSGFNAWLFIYPSDPVKTLMQNGNIGLIEATKKIYSKYGIRGFYKGFGMGLFRSVPLHAGVFLGYETFMKLYAKYVIQKIDW